MWWFALPGIPICNIYLKWPTSHSLRLMMQRLDWLRHLLEATPGNQMIPFLCLTEMKIRSGVLCRVQLNLTLFIPDYLQRYEKKIMRSSNNYELVFLHTEARWLSKGNWSSLQRLVELYDSCVEFLTKLDPLLCDELKLCKNYLFYLANLYSKLNDAQTQLQGRNVTIIQTLTITMSFHRKTEVFKSSLTLNISFKFAR